MEKIAPTDVKVQAPLVPLACINATSLSDLLYCLYYFAVAILGTALGTLLVRALALLYMRYRHLLPPTHQQQPPPTYSRGLLQQRERLEAIDERVEHGH